MGPIGPQCTLTTLGGRAIAESLTAPERETVINWSDDDDTAHVFTWQRRVITKLKRNPSAVLIAEHTFGSTVGAEFEIPANLISFRSKVPERHMSQEQREAARERMRTLRSS